MLYSHKELKRDSRGFTLIELLVVVLIIGILAAIALPQYQKAVLKTQLSKQITMARQLKTAQDSYYMIHGKYSIDFEAMDVGFACDRIDNSSSDQPTCHLNNNKTYIKFFNNVGFYVHEAPFRVTFEVTGNPLCSAILNNAKAVDVCKAMGPKAANANIAGMSDYYRIN